MKTNKSRPQMWWRLAAGALALLTMLAIGTAMAAIPSTTAYHFSSHPMISGTVVTVNDHEMIVDTDQGEQVTLVVDSRTMAPRDLAPGMVMRTQFLALEDCRFYAERIMAVRGGMSTNRLQAYANTRDSHDAIARNASAFGANRQVNSPASAETRESLPLTVDRHSPIMTATPTTSAYQFSTRPMMTGRVVSVNDHRLVVETDQGQQVGLVMDSHTMVPREVAPGTFMTAEFRPMQDGRYYAKRINRINSSAADREPAYAYTHDSDLVLARNIPDCGFVSAATVVTSNVERRVMTPDPVVVSAPAPVVERELPQTASNQPLILLLGLFALGSAGLVTVVRGLRIV